MPLDAREPHPGSNRSEGRESFLDLLFAEHRARVREVLQSACEEAVLACREEIEQRHAGVIARLEDDHLAAIARLEEAHEAALLAREAWHREEHGRLESVWRDTHEARIRDLEARNRSEVEEERRLRTRLELQHVEDLAGRERVWQQDRRDLLEVHAELERRWQAERRDLVTEHEAREARWLEERRRLLSEERGNTPVTTSVVALEPPAPDPAVLEQVRAEGYQAGLEAARRELEGRTPSLEQQLSASYEEGLREGQKRSGGGVGLDEARRQAYQNGYEDGKGVGFARGKRQVESELSARMQDSARTAYREGFRDGQSSGGDPERSWARGILHLPAGASVPPHELRQRYKRLSLVLHPDQNPGLGDEFIKNLNRAREVLEA
jgi:hypothetical protein